MYEFHWLAEPFWPGTSWAMANPKSAAGRPCSGALFWSVSSNFTTGGPLIVTLVIFPVIVVAVLTFRADPVLDGPGGPVAPGGPAAPLADQPHASQLRAARRFCLGSLSGWQDVGPRRFWDLRRTPR